MTDLLNISEGAKELNISVHTLRAWIFQRRLSFVRLGRRILLRREDLEDFVNRNRVDARRKE
jgi:excisionase family DNA binding protein